jgi:hypothetical protein
MILEIKSDISRQLIVQIAFAKILSILQISNSTTEVNFDDLEHSYIVNSLFSSRDIYNVKAQMRREALESLTFVQALIRELNQSD